MTFEVQKVRHKFKINFLHPRTLKKLYHIIDSNDRCFSTTIQIMCLSFHFLLKLRHFFPSFYETSHKRINDILKTESEGPLEALLNQSLTNKHFHFRSGTQFRGIFKDDPRISSRENEKLKVICPGDYSMCLNRQDVTWLL